MNILLGCFCAALQNRTSHSTRHRCLDGDHFDHQEIKFPALTTAQVPAMSQALHYCPEANFSSELSFSAALSSKSIDPMASLDCRPSFFPCCCKIHCSYLLIPSLALATLHGTQYHCPLGTNVRGGFMQ